MTTITEVGQSALLKFDIQIRKVKEFDSQTPKSFHNVIRLVPEQPTYRILIVEDNQMNRLLMVRMLTSVGFEGREAIHGQAAVEVWKSWRPYLIWMDMQMPMMNGYEATRQIRAGNPGSGAVSSQQSAVNRQQSGFEGAKRINPLPLTHSPHSISSPRFPVIIDLTAAAFDLERERMLASGCDDFVSKPLKRDVIFDNMSEYLGVRYVYRLETDKRNGNEGPKF